MHICVLFSFDDQKGLKHVSCYILMTTLAVPTDLVYTSLLLDHSGMLLLNEFRSSPSSGEKDSGFLGWYATLTYR
jgi:hypothetical protein